VGVGCVRRRRSRESVIPSSQPAKKTDDVGEGMDGWMDGRWSDERCSSFNYKPGTPAVAPVLRAPAPAAVVTVASAVAVAAAPAASEPPTAAAATAPA
jgi:hypothetical protein